MLTRYESELMREECPHIVLFIIIIYIYYNTVMAGVYAEVYAFKVTSLY